MLYHLEDIEIIRAYEQIVRNSGTEVFDISHWDSGQDYNKLLLSTLNIPKTFRPCNYVYSYEIGNKIHSITQKELVGTSRNECCVFFSNSTMAIVNVCNLLQKKSIKKVCLLQPSYFSVTPCMNTFNIAYDEISLNYVDGKYEIPIDKILATNYDAIWITSPVFCTSTYFKQQEIDKIQLLLNRGNYVICDESLSIKGMGIRHKLNHNENLFSIYSPHKVISTNSFKFSCIICDEKYERFFDQWTDIFSGGLMNSSRLAIQHFLSKNYLECLEIYIKYTNALKENVVSYIEAEFSNSNICCSHEIGHYMTIYCPSVPFIETTKPDFIKRLILNTGVSLLPGYLEGFCEELGFCFRINLTLNKVPLLSNLNRVLKYLSKHYS